MHHRDTSTGHACPLGTPMCRLEACGSRWGAVTRGTLFALQTSLRVPRLASPSQTRFRTHERSAAAAEKKDRLEAISLPTVTHALPTYGSCLATRCRFAPRADCGRTSCASTTAHMCILGLTHTLTDSCNPAKLSGRPLWQHDTGGSSSSRTGAHPHVRPGEKSSQTGCCSRIDLPRSAISTPELPLACSICVLARTILRWREAAAWRADETR